MSRRLARENAFKYIYAINVKGADKNTTIEGTIETTNSEAIEEHEEYTHNDEIFFETITNRSRGI